MECIKTNIHGAENVIHAALDNEVEKVIALSTDKAANPINLYGATKLASDKLFVAANNIAGGHRTRFAVVRYGNVVGSRGSVVPFFRKLIARGRDGAADHRRAHDALLDHAAAGRGLRARELRAHARRRDLRAEDPFDAASSTWPRRWRPDLPHKIVGIRPGEKLHEIMCPARRLAPDAGVRRSLRDPADDQRSASSVDYAINARARTAKPVARGLRIQLRHQPALPAASPRSARSTASRRRHDPVRPPGIDEADIEAVVDGAALGLPDPGPGGRALRGGGRGAVRRAARGGGQQRHLGPAHRLPGARRSGPGDVVWTVPNTFVASANCARYCGAEVDFVDIDPRTYNMSVAGAGAQAARRRGRRDACRRSSCRCTSAASPATCEAIRALAERLRLPHDRGRLARDRRDATAASRSAAAAIATSRSSASTRSRSSPPPKAAWR